MSVYDQLQSSSVIRTAKDFGAVGDGVTDDTQALQAALDAVQDGQTLKLEGRFSVSKNLGFRGDLYGNPADLSGFPTHGAQPCLSLIGKSQIILDCRAATFVVAQHGQGILDLFGCQGCLVLGGSFVGPGNFPGIDGLTGYAEKGVAGAGFNTTTHSPAIDGARNNWVDTSGSTQGGYGGAFPQDDGSTASTWGSWQGG